MKRNCIEYNVAFALLFNCKVDRRLVGHVLVRLQPTLAIVTCSVSINVFFVFFLDPVVIGLQSLLTSYFS